MKCPVMVAPAMDLDMYKHPANQKNIDTLRSFGNMIIEPESGELASGLTGKGRMQEPETIVEEVVAFFQKKKNWPVAEYSLLPARPTKKLIQLDLSEITHRAKWATL